METLEIGNRSVPVTEVKISPDMEPVIIVLATDYAIYVSAGDDHTLVVHHVGKMVDENGEHKFDYETQHRGTYLVNTGDQMQAYSFDKADEVPV